MRKRLSPEQFYASVDSALRERGLHSQSLKKTKTNTKPKNKQTKAKQRKQVKKITYKNALLRLDKDIYDMFYGS